MLDSSLTLEMTPIASLTAARSVFESETIFLRSFFAGEGVGEASGVGGIGALWVEAESSELGAFEAIL